MRLNNKLLKGVLCLLIAFVFVSSNVYAEAGNIVTGVVSMTCDKQEDGTYGIPTGLYFNRGYGSGLKKYQYHDFEVTIKDTGEKYKGYCLDVGYGFSCINPVTMECEELDLKSYKMYKYVKDNEDIDAATFSLLTRVIGHYYGFTQPALPGLGTYLENIAKNNFEIGSMASNFSGDLTILNSALEHAKKAKESTGEGEEGTNPEEESTQPEAVKITFKRRDSIEGCKVITYDITSSVELINDSVKFTIKQGGKIINSSWNGKEGTISIEPDMTEENCERKIKILMEYKVKNEDETTDEDYNGTVYFCRQTRNNELQNVLAVGLTNNPSDQDDTHEYEFEDSYPPQCTIPGCEECCTPGIDVDKYKEKDINNCCYINTESILREWDLDDIFCDRNGVSHSFIKCNGEVYEETLFPENPYCDMYCTERVHVTTPGAKTATSGRYFTLEKFEVNIPGEGTVLSAAPYIEEVRRCRIIIKYDKWDKDYKKEIDDEIEAYNNFQYAAAMEKVYANAVANSQTVSGTFTSSVICAESVAGSGVSCSGGTISEPYTYTKYTAKPSDQKYTIVKLDDNYYNSHDGWRILEDTDPKKRHSFSAGSEEFVYGVDSIVARINSQVTSISNANPGCSCYSKPVNISNAPELNVEQALTDAKALKEQYQSLYEMSVTQANILEDKLDQCDKFFEPDGEGLTQAALEKYYKVADMDLKFSYEQIYNNEDGVATLDRIYVDFDGRFNGKACKVSAYGYNNQENAYIPNDNDVFEDRYSDKYKKGEAKSYSFRLTELQLETNFESIKSKYLKTNDPYRADKKFTTDGAYTAVCNWVEERTKYYTLVPGGLVQTSATVNNYVMHPSSIDAPVEYQVYLNTYEGTYGTYWELSGIGHNGRLDHVFLEDSKTCTNESADATEGGGNHINSDIPFSCSVKVKDKIVIVGYCPPSDEGEYEITPTYDPNVCDPEPEKYNFQFKTAAADNLFPNGTTTESGTEYAYNWTSTEAGTKLMGELQTNSEAVFAPENSTYSVVLTGSDIKTIKRYNESVIDDGGYKDFDLICDCALNGGTTNCNKCLSDFITNMYNGVVEINNKQYELTGKTSAYANELIKIRNNNNWRTDGE